MKNRKTAVLITVIVIIAATLFGVNRSLDRFTRDTEAMFYDGVYIEGAGYTQPGIAAQIDRYTDATLGLTTVLINYPELHDSAEVVLEQRRAVIGAESISAKGLAFRLLSGNVYSLIKAAGNVDLRQRDIEDVSYFSATIDGAEAFIRDSAYNHTVSKLLNEQIFITRILRRFLPVRDPEMF